METHVLKGRLEWFKQGLRGGAAVFVLLVALPRLNAHPLLAHPPPISNASVSAPLAPVTIEGDRFYAGDQPYFPTTNFLTNGAPYPYTHVYFSDGVSDVQRAAMLQTLRNEGYNAIFLYTINAGDYGRKSVTPYLTSTPAGSMGGAFDDARLTRWRAELEKMINTYGLRPVLWLFPDDSPSIHGARETEHKRYIAEMVRRFDDLPVMWVLGLELDEYWKDKAYVNRLGQHLQSLANNPVGVHQTPNRTDYMTAAWVDFGIYQYGFDTRGDPAYWEKLYEKTKTALAALGGKPLIAGEYDELRDQTDVAEAQRIGLAAAFAGAAGATNGAPPELDELMATLPDGMRPARHGTVLSLIGPQMAITTNVGNARALRFAFPPGRSP